MEKHKIYQVAKLLKLEVKTFKFSFINTRSDNVNIRSEKWLAEIGHYDGDIIDSTCLTIGAATEEEALDLLLLEVRDLIIKGEEE